MTQASHNVILFARLEVDGAEDLKVHSGLGSSFYRDSPWSRYIGMGNLLTCSTCVDTSNTIGNKVTLSIALPNDDDLARARRDLRKLALEANLQDKGVKLDLYREGIDPEPVLWLLCRVEQATITTDLIQVDCYTSSAQMNKVHYAPTIYSDLQQTQIVNVSDRSMRFANTEIEEAGLELP